MPSPLSTASDSALIQLFLNGENAAFEALLHRHKDRIYTAIFLLVKDRELAEDLFQDCFLKMLCTLRKGQYDEQGKFLPWALRVAHNLCMDHFRRAKTRIAVRHTEPELLQNMGGPVVEQPSRMEQLQDVQNVRTLIENLPEEQRRGVTLRIYGELSFKEIAELTGVSINTALGRMRYALINMRRHIDCEQLEDLL